MDEHIPFTCKITKEYCGSEINYINIELNHTPIVCIPISPAIKDIIDGKLKRKISKVIIKEIKDCINGN